MALLWQKHETLVLAVEPYRKGTVIRLTFRTWISTVAASLMIAGVAPSHAAAENLCDPSTTNCRTQLLALIDNEKVGIDVGFWFMEDSRYASHIINRWTAGVPVRVIADPRANPGHPLNQQMLDSFQSAGIPIMQKSGGAIMHFKMMLFAGQNMVEFGSANFSDNAFVPVSAYTNYVSETIYYCDDPAIVNSFKTKVDNIWTDTTNYKPYANVTSRVRTYPTYTISADMNFPPGQSYTQRLTNLEKTETQQIDVIMFRVTQQAHSDATIAAINRGVKVRYLGETNEYRLLNADGTAPRLWVPWNMDRMWAAGVPMKVRGNQGENHEKLVLMYSKVMSVFGSGNWTSPSDNSQQEHNYFTTKSWIFQWYVDQFNRKWNNSTGNIETTDFVPLPPDTPFYRSPANGATGVATDSQKLVWYGGPWAHYYDIYFGTDPTASTLLAAEQHLGPSETTSQTQSFTLPTLQPGTTYYWRIVSKTAAGVSTIRLSNTPRTCTTCAKVGPIWSFTTTGTTPPPPPPSGSATTVVMWAANIPAANVHGNWTFLTDSSAAGGKALQNPDKGASKISPALASPTNYFEQTFTAEAGTAYHLYVRMRAQNNSMSNDSVSVQFSDSVDSGGLAAMRIGSSSASEIILQGGSSDSGISGWGWADANWSGPAPLVYFAASGTHTVRVQQREDGAIVDQIVLSPDTYLNSPPGPRDNDSTILPSTDSTSGGGGGGGGTPSAATVVMWAANVPSANVHGNWAPAADAAAAGGTALFNANQGAAKISPPLASPTSYFEQTFTADAGKAYHLWVRMRAQSNSTANDSVSVQFSDSVDSGGNAIMRIGSATGAEIILQNGSTDSGVSGWGWADANWSGPAVNVYFAASGTHTVRVQQREDGPYVDQIVLSPDTYLTSAPGPRDNDATILPSTDSSSGTASLGPNTVVVWAANIPAASVNGSWQLLADSTAAGGSALWNPNAGQAKITPALASASNFFEATFSASAGVAYHLWVRLRAPRLNDTTTLPAT